MQGIHLVFYTKLILSYLSQSNHRPPLNSSVPNQPSDPPEELLLEIEKIVGDISSSSSTEPGHPLIQAPITLCGRVINAIIWEEQLWNLIQREHIIHIGSFVRLRNINKARLPTLAAANCKLKRNGLSLFFLL